MKRFAWDCKKCELHFRWVVSEQTTELEKEYDESHLKLPKTEKEWKEAELYASNDTVEWYWASDTDEACKDCVEKMKTKGVKYSGHIMEE